jgi:aminoglycoside phosphotransferase (APT) family kinase protein
MSFSPFLASIAEALLQRVRPAIADARSTDALDACVRALVGLAAALEPMDQATLASLPCPNPPAKDPPPHRVNGPAENPAANSDSAPRLAAAAAWLSQGTWLTTPEQHATAQAMLHWEHVIGRDKIATMTRREQGGPDSSGDTAKLAIDPAAVQSYLRSRFANAGIEITGFRQMIGGRSRQTAVFAQTGAPDLPAGLVVQRDHPASINNLGVATQFPVLQHVALSPLRTARPLLLETDRSVLGAPFMLLERAPGHVAGADYFQPPQTPHLAYELAAQLAILHRIDPSGLAGIVPTTVDQPGPAGWTADLDRIEAAWHRFKFAPSLSIAAALAWMHARVTQIGDERAIIHNDAAFHNILVQDGHMSSLLDWELTHLGHPAEDLGYCRYFVQEIADWAVFLQAYEAAGGIRFSRTVIDYFSLRAGIHLMTLLQYGRSMFLAGITTDINLAETATSFVPKQHNRIAAMVQTVIGP